MTSDDAPGEGVGRDARAPRADAVRNRAAILDAADAVLAEQGLGADVREIARRAGVGMGTLYRHFPRKEELVCEVIAAAYAAWAAAGRAAIEDVADPWQALAVFAETSVQRQAAHRGLREAAAHGVPLGAHDCLEPLFAVANDVLARVDAAGLVRGGVTAADILMIFTATAQCRQSSPDDDWGWRRALRVYLDGLRSDHAQALPGPRAAAG